METQKEKIAVVVLNWNGRKWLEIMLPFLIRYSQQAKIFIADNASNDDSILFVEKNYPKIKIISNKSNNGYAKGYNDVLKKIDSEYYVLINSDIEVSKNWIDPIINLMDNDNKIAACQPKILNYNNRNYFEYAGASGGYIDLLGYPLCRGRIFDTLEKDEGQYNDVIEVFWASGACLFVRASYFNEIGGLDEDFFAHQEEIDLCWRFKNKDYKIMVQPESIVYHVGGGTLNSSSGFKTYLNFRNNLSMLFKNLSLFEIIWIMPSRLILDGIAALRFLLQKHGNKHFFAVLQAHISFYLNLPKNLIKRLKIRQKLNQTGRLSFSILIKYYIANIKKFKDF